MAACWSRHVAAGTGVPLLAVHGSGGGYDQGMAFAGALADHGIRVIAMSRFGYLRTPMPADASAAAQADAHVCLLDALGVRPAAVMGGSAGAPSALQMAIRHVDRVSALVLLVPLAYKPPTLADSAPPLAPWVENTMMRLIGSDFLFWAAIHMARDQVIKVVLATPPHPSFWRLPAWKSVLESTRCSTTSFRYPPGLPAAA
jgi:2-hydroxy-6-oxonona-2,4-dienedioate hydrolase